MDRFGRETARRILDADNSASAMDLLVNPRRTDRETLREALAREGIATELSGISPLGLSVISSSCLMSTSDDDGQQGAGQC